MLKRIFYFLLINLFVVVTISATCSIFNISPLLSKGGFDMTHLAIFCLIWGVAGSFISLLLSKHIAKWLMGVVPLVRNTQNEKLFELVDELSRKAHLCKPPELGFFESQSLNAFATGATKKKSMIAFSTALLNNIEERKLKAIIAHELAHISNGDMITMSLLQGVINAFVMFLSRVIAHAITTSSKISKRNSKWLMYSITLGLELIFMSLGTILLCWFSRKREYQADKQGAFLTCKEDMIAALQFLDFKSNPSNACHLDKTQAALMVFPIRKKKWNFLFSTHPSIEDRIKKLENAKNDIF